MEIKECSELEAILYRLSGLLDNLYMSTEDEYERDYINSVENELRTYLVEKGLINDN